MNPQQQFARRPEDISIIVSPTNDLVFKKVELIVQYANSTYEFKKLDTFEPAYGSNTFTTSIIVGKVDTLRNSYLIVSKEIKYIGDFLKCQIYQITKFAYIPISTNPTAPEEEQRYLKMFDDFLARNTLYFSDKIDLTISVKNYSLHKASQIMDNKGSFLFPFTIENFCWNYKIASFFDVKYMDEFVFPIINGFIGIKPILEYSIGKAYCMLMSRKEHCRSGMRFIYRGADEKGHCANFAEIEEFLYLEEQGVTKIYCFEQIRGSIPLRWEQKPACQLNPPIKFRGDANSNYDCLKLHFEEVAKYYGDCVVVNLIDKKKYQLKIGEQYQKMTLDYKKEISGKKKEEIDFVWFDFHHECKKMKYQNIAKLFKASSVSKGLREFNYTIVEISDSLQDKINSNNLTRQLLQAQPERLDFKQIQKGVFRTNCVDSLDRTNVVQTCFARYFLHKIFSDLKLEGSFNGEPFEIFKPEFEKIFKNIWADNGDYISKAYSGTGAMKSDFVRTGKRSTIGALNDGILTSTRFYINNFCDGYNQDCHDYFLEKISPKKEQFKMHNNFKLFIILPSTIIFGLFMFIFMRNIALPADHENDLKKMFFKLILFAGSFYLSFGVVFGNFKSNLIDSPTKPEK